jgi:hypothetical protein
MASTRTTAPARRASAPARASTSRPAFAADRPAQTVGDALLAHVAATHLGTRLADVSIDSQEVLR